MLNKILRTGMLAAAFASVTISTSAAQTPVRPVPAQPIPGQAAAVPAQANNHFRAKQVIGTKIMIQNNTAVGVVDDLVFDDAGNLEYLIVNNEGKLTTVPFEAAQFNVQQNTATLTVTQEQYNTIPTYTTTNYPSFYTPEYRTQVYKAYDITPRELRRIERRNR